MKVSIITTAFNSAETIEDTIKSVLSQTHADIEYIIIDGGSTDRTLEIISKYKDRIAVLVSEKDDGIYDAMDKGVRHATGDIVGILNADDFLFSKTAIEDVVRAFKSNDVDACYGNVIFCDRKDTAKIKRYWRAGEYKAPNLRFGWTPPHPAFYVKKECYDKFGPYRLDLSIAADYELMLRFFKKHLISSTFLDETLVCMRVGGLSSRNIFFRFKGLFEVYKSWRVNYLPIPPFLFLRVPTKMWQFLSK